MGKAPGTRPGEKQWKERRVHDCVRWRINLGFLLLTLDIGDLVRLDGGIT